MLLYGLLQTLLMLHMKKDCMAVIIPETLQSKVLQSQVFQIQVLQS